MKTKSLSEICQLVKTEYVEKERYDDWVQEDVAHSGFCSSVRYLVGEANLSCEEQDLFMTEYEKSIENQRLFYLFNGEKSDARGQFAWRVSNRSARIKWLDQRI